MTSRPDLSGLVGRGQTEGKTRTYLGAFLSQSGLEGELRRLSSLIYRDSTSTIQVEKWREGEEE